MLSQKKILIGKILSLTLLLVVFCAGIFFVFNTSRASEKNIEQNITLNSETKEGEESALLPALSETQNSSTNEISNSLLVSGDGNADDSTGDDVAEGSYGQRILRLSAPGCTYCYIKAKWNAVGSILGVNTKSGWKEASGTDYCEVIDGGEDGNWSFDGWTDITVSATAPAGYYVVYPEMPNGTTEQDYTITLSCEPIVCTFNANGGSGSMNDITVVDGAITIPENSFTREGMVFAGWYLSLPCNWGTFDHFEWVAGNLIGIYNYANRDAFFPADMAGVAISNYLNGVDCKTKMSSSSEVDRSTVLYNPFYTPGSKYYPSCNEFVSSYQSDPDLCRRKRMLSALWAYDITLENEYRNGGGERGHVYEYVSAYSSGITNRYGYGPIGNGGVQKNLDNGNFVFTINTPTHLGYNTFDGYFESPNDTNPLINGSGQFTVAASFGDSLVGDYYFGSSKTLYAKFSDPKSFTLNLQPNYDSSFGSTPLNQSITYWESVTIPYPTRDGYTFNFAGSSISGGWSVTNNTSNRTITFTCDRPGNETFTPAWTGGIYKVVFHNYDYVVGQNDYADNKDVNEVSNVRVVQNFTYGDNPLEPAVALQTNDFANGTYVFKGWATTYENALKGVIAYTDAQEVRNLIVPTVVNNAVVYTQNNEQRSTVHLYAVWAIPYNIRACYNSGTDPNAYTIGDDVGGTVKFHEDSSYYSTVYKEYWHLDSNGNQIRPSVDVQPAAHYTFMGWYRKTQVSSGVILSNNKVVTWGTSTLTALNNQTLTGSFIPSDGEEWYAWFEVDSFEIVMKINNDVVDQANITSNNPYGYVGSIDVTKDTRRSTSSVFRYFYGTSYTAIFAEKKSNNTTVGHYVGLTSITSNGVAINSGYLMDDSTKTFTIASITQNVEFTVSFIPIWNSEVIDISIVQVSGNEKTFTYTGFTILPQPADVVIRNKLTNEIVNSSLYSTYSPGDNDGKNMVDVVYNALNQQTLEHGAYFYAISTDATQYYFAVNAYNEVLSQYILEGTFIISPRDISGSGFVFTLGTQEFTFDGQEQRPGLNDATYAARHNVTHEIKYINVTHEIEYANNINVTRDGNGVVQTAAQAIVQGTGNYCGTKTLYFRINPATIATAIATYTNNYYYTNLLLNPANIYDFGATYSLWDETSQSFTNQEIVNGTDYQIQSIAGQDYKNFGTRYFKIVGIGNFTSEKELAFNINQIDLSDTTNLVLYNGTNTQTEQFILTPHNVMSWVFTGQRIEPTIGTNKGIDSIEITIKGLNNYPFNNVPSTVTTGGYYTFTLAAGAQNGSSNDFYLSYPDDRTNIDVAFDSNDLITAGGEIYVNGAHNFCGARTINFTITKKNITEAIYFGYENNTYITDKHDVSYNASYQAPSPLTDSYIAINDSDRNGKSDFMIQYYRISSSTPTKNTSLYSLWVFGNNIFLNAGTYYLDFFPTRTGNYGFLDGNGNEIVYYDATGQEIVYNDVANNLVYYYDATGQLLRYYNKTTNEIVSDVTGITQKPTPYRLTYTINRRAASLIQVSIDDAEIVYDGQGHSPSLSVSDGTILSSEDYDLYYRFSNEDSWDLAVPIISNVSQGTVQILFNTKANNQGFQNYTSAGQNGAGIQFTFKIVPLAISFDVNADNPSTATLQANYDLTYNKAYKTPSVTITAKANDLNNAYTHAFSAASSNVNNFFNINYNNNQNVCRNSTNLSNPTQYLDSNGVAYYDGASVTITAPSYGNYSFAPYVIRFAIAPRSVTQSGNLLQFVGAENDGSLRNEFNNTYQYPTFAVVNTTESNIFVGEANNLANMNNVYVYDEGVGSYHPYNFQDVAIVVYKLNGSNEYDLLGNYSSNPLKFFDAGTYKLVFTGQCNYTGNYELIYRIDASTISTIDYTYTYTDVHNNLQTVVNGKNTQKFYSTRNYAITEFNVTFTNGDVIVVDATNLNGCTVTYTQAGQSTANPAALNWRDATAGAISIFFAASGNYTGSANLSFLIEQLDLATLLEDSENNITASDYVQAIPNLQYTADTNVGITFIQLDNQKFGNLITDLNIKSAGVPVYYALAYALPQTGVGTATITITPQGNYTGNSFSVTFQIVKYQITNYEVILRNGTSTSFEFDNLAHGTELAEYAGIRFDNADGNSVIVYQDDGGTFTFTYTRTSGDSSLAANVGTFEMGVAANGLNSTLYEFASNVVETKLVYYITQKAFNIDFIDWQGSNAIYDGFSHRPNPVVIDNQLSLNLVTAGQVSVNLPQTMVNAGSYVVEIVLDTTKNYSACNIDAGGPITKVVDGTNVKYQKTFVISKKDFDPTTVDVLVESLTYNGSAQTPSFTVIDKDLKALYDGGMTTVNYVIFSNTTISNSYYHYSNNGQCINANQPYQIIIDLSAANNPTNYVGYVGQAFTISAKSIDDSSIAVSIPNKHYNKGLALFPDEVVTDSERQDAAYTSVGHLIVFDSTTSEGDYTIRIVNLPNGATEAGTYEVRIAGRNNYTGERTVSFTIDQLVIGENTRIELSLSGTNFNSTTNEYVFNNAVQKPDLLVEVYVSNDGVNYTFYDSFTVESTSTETISPESSTRVLSYVYEGNDLTDPQKFVYAKTYRVVFNGNVNYALKQGLALSDHSIQYSIVKKELEASMFNTTCGNFYIYDNQDHVAVVNSATFNSFVLQPYNSTTHQGDYNVSYKRDGVTASDFKNAGQIVLVATADLNSINFTGEVEIPYTINQQTLDIASISLTNGLQNYVYNGDYITPPLTITCQYPITTDDYEIKYQISAQNTNEPINAGTGYLIVVEGKRNFTDSCVLTYDIQKASFTTLDLQFASNPYNRNNQQANIKVAQVNTNTSSINNAYPLSGDYDIFYKTANDIESADATDFVNAGTIYVFVVAKANTTTNTENFQGSAVTTFTISQAEIDDIQIQNNSNGNVYNTQSWQTNIESRVRVYAGSVQLNAGEYVLKYYRSNVETNDLTNSGSIKVEVWANTLANPLNFTDKTTKPYATFVIQKKELNNGVNPAQNIEIEFFFADDDTPFDLSNQTYTGREVYPVVKYYYNGTGTSQPYVTLTQNDPSNPDDPYDFVFDHIPTSWIDATTEQYEYKMKLIFTANTQNYVTDGDGIILTYRILPAAWDSEHIRIVIQKKTYTGNAITLTASDILEAIYTPNVGSPVNLVLGTDYIIETNYNLNGFTNGYYNNTEASRVYDSVAGEWTAEAMVVFKSISPNYDTDATLGIRFVIEPYNIALLSYNLPSTNPVYNAQEQYPVVSGLTFNSTDLVRGTDYDIILNGDINLKPIDAGNYTLVIKGKGNFTGQMQTTYTIDQKPLDSSDIVVTLLSSQEIYNGIQQTPTIVSVVMGGVTDLEEGADFSVSYTYTTFVETNYTTTTLQTGFVNAGIYLVTLTPASANFSNSQSVTYTISRANLSEIIISPSYATYDGTNKQPSTASIVINAGTNSDIPKENIEITYQVYDISTMLWNNTPTPDFVNAGTTRIVATATNQNVNYGSFCYFDFVINPKVLTQSSITVDDSNCVYERTNQYAVVSVLDGSTPLTLNTHFETTYSGELYNAGNNAATVLVEGIGNYSFSYSFTYSIAKKNINDLTFDATAIPTVEFTGYSISIDSQLVGVLVHNGHTLSDSEFAVVYAQASRVDADDYDFALTGAPNGNYTGTIENLSFTVAPRDLTGNADIEIEFVTAREVYFTGAGIEPTVRVLDKGSVLKLQIDANNLDIDYEDNINVYWSNSSTIGMNATVVVTGQNNYKGSTSAKFKILPRQITDSDVIKTFEERVVSPTGGYYILTPQLYTGDYITFTINSNDAQLKLTFNNESLLLSTVYHDNLSKTTGDDPSDLAYVDISILENEGIKNFDGTLRMYFAITDLSILMADIIWDDPNVFYDSTSGFYYVYYNTQTQLPKPRFVYLGTPLVEDVDYTVSATNTNYDSTTGYGDYVNVTRYPISVSIVGTGDTYGGAYHYTYEIRPFVMTASNTTISGVVAKEFTGEEVEQDKTQLTITVAVGSYNVVLTQNEFALTYEENVNAGTASMTVSATLYSNPQTQKLNNFSGGKDTSFVITPKRINSGTDPASGISLVYKVGDVRYAINEYTPTYTGNGITPEVILIFNNHEYEAPASFTTSYDGNINVVRNYNSLTDAYDVLQNGATVTINADAISNGNFIGSLDVFFTILPKTVTVDDFNFAIGTAEMVYDGIAYEPTFQTFTDKTTNVVLTGNDYRIVGYEDNVHASTQSSKAKVVVEFIKNYVGADGELRFNFEILPFDLNDATIVWNTLGGHVFNGLPHEVEITITFEDRNGDEHEIDSYTTSTTRNGQPTVDLTHAGDVVISLQGVGDFGGEPVAETLTIACLSISEIDYIMEEDPNIFIFKNDWIEPGITTSYNNYLLSEAEGDYEISYSNNKYVSYNGTHVVAGAYIILTSKEGGNVTGTLEIPFTITPRDLGGAGISIGATTEFVYTGSEITPEQIVLSYESIAIAQLAENVDYVLSFSNRIMPGVVTITATGRGNFTGTRTTSYTILTRSFAYIEFEWIDDVENLVFNRSDRTPRFKLTYIKDNIEEELVAGQDYSYEYINNVHASTNATLENKPLLTINGTGGYADVENVLTRNFEIQQYDVGQLLAGRKLTSRKANETSWEAMIWAELDSILTYKSVTLVRDVDYDYSVSGTGEVLYVSSGTITFTITGKNDFKNSGTISMQILKDSINNVLLFVDGVQNTSGNVQVVFKGSAYVVQFVARSGNKIIGTNGYDVIFKDANDNEISAQTLNVSDNTFEITNAQTLKIIIEGIGDYMGTAYAEIVINRKDINADEITLDGLTESFVYYFGVPQEQPNARLEMNSYVLNSNSDYSVVYFNNAYAGEATVMFVGRGNFNGYRTAHYIITKRASTVNPYFENIVYYEGDRLPILNIGLGDTRGSITWDMLNENKNATLLSGVREYAWTFYPNDTSNMLEAHGVLTINATPVRVERIDVFGDYKTDYYVFESFDTTNIIVYLVYNNGRTQLLNSSEYSLNVAHGDEVYLNTVPVITYSNENQTMSVLLRINITKIKLGLQFEDVDGIIQKEKAQFITPVITNSVENHEPSIIVRYYSQAIGAYTDGITQSGDYIISVNLVGDEYEFEDENTITIHVRTGILKSNDGKVLVIDEQGFEDNVRLTVREYSSTSQLDEIIDTRTFSVKKCYEIQLWKDGQEYFSSHVLTIRFNLGRDILEQNNISALQVPSNADIYYECEYKNVDRDTIELSTKMLGAFVFGEKTDYMGTSWWIALVIGLVILIAVTISAMIFITKRRKRRKIANGINYKLGRR